MPLASTRSPACCAIAGAAIRNADSARPLTASKLRDFIALLLGALARKNAETMATFHGEPRRRKFLQAVVEIYSRRELASFTVSSMRVFTMSPIETIRKAGCARRAPAHGGSGRASSSPSDLRWCRFPCRWRPLLSYRRRSGRQRRDAFFRHGAHHIALRQDADKRAVRSRTSKAPMRFRARRRAASESVTSLVSATTSRPFSCRMCLTCIVSLLLAALKALVDVNTSA